MTCGEQGLVCVTKGGGGRRDSTGTARSVEMDRDVRCADQEADNVLHDLRGWLAGCGL